MCDVIRGSARVVVMLLDKELHHKQEWGMPMWTLPEGLLAPGNSLFSAHPMLHGPAVTSQQ
jgi:hypothetical protein